MTDPFAPPDLTPGRAPPQGRRLFSVGFWAMMALCLLCVLAGAAVVAFGPMFTGPGFTGHGAPAAPPPSVTPAAAPPPYSAATPPPAVGGPAGDAAIAVSTLTERVERLEGGQDKALRAATEALAAAALADAAAQPRPFGDTLAAFERILPFSPDARALRPLAAQGAPTRAALAAALGDEAAAVAVAARRPDRQAGIMANLSYAVSRVVEVRRIDGGGSPADAALARAQSRAAAGDLEGAVQALDALPATAQGALAAWRAQAARRIEIDRHVANLRAEALAGLASAPVASPTASPTASPR
jgi:hypothetical protein